MHRRRRPTPTRSSDMVRDYLDIINSKQTQCGKAKRHDIYRRAGSEAQTDRVLKYFLEIGLVEGNDQTGYKKTRLGEDMHEILKKRELIGILTRDLAGTRIKHR